MRLLPGVAHAPRGKPQKYGEDAKGQFAAFLMTENRRK